MVPGKAPARANGRQEIRDMSSSTIDEDYDYEDDFDDFDEDDDEPGFSGLVVLLMGGLMLGVMVAVVFIAYSHGVKMGEARNDPPYVSADPNPVKVEAAEFTPSYADREVYDRPSGGVPETAVVIAEAPEEPVSRDGEATPDANPLLDVATRAADNAGDDVDDRIGALAARATQDDEPSVEDVSETARGAARPVQVAARQTSQPAREPMATQRPAAAGGAAGAGALSGSHVVQIAALQSRAEAEAAWRRISRKLGDYARGKSPDVLAPTSSSDIYYRLRVGPFATRDAANAYCAGLKERDQGCMVRAN